MLSFRVFLKRKYFAPAFLYSCFSLVFSTWVTYIPYIADKLNISEGKIGGALFFMSFGSLLMIPVSNRLTYKLGLGRQAFLGFTGYAMALFGMFLAPNYSLLCCALFIFGTMSAVFSISLNSLTAVIEKESKMYIMTGSHGFWSLGGIVGSSTGSFIAGLLGMPLLHISLLVLLLFSIQLFFLRKEYWHIKGEFREKEKNSRFQIKPLLIIALVALIMMVSEGAIADWSALYLKKIVLLKYQYIGLGYACFSFGMALGRFTGDSLSSRLGSWKLLRLAIGTSLIGFLMVLLAFPFSAMPGFFIIGLGFSIIVPEVFRVTSTIKTIKTADGISFISGVTNAGFLGGPVILGFIAELKDLRFSFAVLTGIVCIALGLTFLKKQPYKR